MGGEKVLLFCGPRRTDKRQGAADASGVWMVSVRGELGDVRVDDAQLIAGTPLYAGRIVHDRSGTPVLLAFIGAPGSEHELAGITDPMAVTTESSVS
ncbi:hypothetical protein [Microbacterium sp. CH12i]|uniref:hypothetical protein n=1 Tax=Microbacterium sp. CH12i TaxID=1479651 RepID=UPI0012683260|nr:hypothetical protein [Microbacterium sp. CH12i]